MRGTYGTVIVALLGGLLVAAAGYYAIVLRPWLVYPEESAASIEARFGQVEAWGWPGPEADVDAAPTQKLVAAIGRAEEDLRAFESLRDAKRGPVEVTDAVAEAIAALIDWHSAGASLAISPCEQDLSALGYFGVGRAALVSAPEAGWDVPVEAVLHLAAQLRKRGNPLQAIVGFKLADEAAHFAQSTGKRPHSMFRRWAPSDDEIFPLVAREAFCTTALVAEELERGRSPNFVDSEARPPLGAPLSASRELLYLKKVWSDLLERAAEVSRSSELLSAALAVDRAQLPKSAVVRLMLPSVAHALVDIPAGAVRDYRESIAQLAEGEPAP